LQTGEMLLMSAVLVVTFKG